MLGSNVANTPWIGDMDGDGKMNIATTTTIELTGQRNDIDLSMNLRVFHIKTPYAAKQEIPWGGYMGSNCDGVFRKKRKRPNVAKRQ